MSEFEILLTNDDGIDATGLRALYRELSGIGDVTVVAPATDQSAVGRVLSESVAVRGHELGYAIDGTPADCVVAALSTLVPESDLVVAGCNHGANLGAAVLGRSGTVSAAVEAAFLDVPAVAVSMYIPPEVYSEDRSGSLVEADYREAAEATAYLIEHAPDIGVFETADYLNVNAPYADDADPEMMITRPSSFYPMDAIRSSEGEIQRRNPIWELMGNDSVPDPEGTDRRAVLDGNVSVSPLTAPHSTHQHDGLDDLADRYASPDRAGRTGQ